MVYLEDTWKRIFTYRTPWRIYRRKKTCGRHIAGRKRVNGNLSTEDFKKEFPISSHCSRPVYKRTLKLLSSVEDL